MGWQAYLSIPATPNGTHGSQVTVQYFDDADPANVGTGLLGPGQGTAAASTNLVTVNGHGLVAGDQVIFSALAGGAPLAVDTPYYVIAAGLTSSAFSVATSPSGPAVDITANATALTAYRLRPPANVLYEQSWTLPLGQTINDLLPAIDRAGQDARAVYLQAAALNTGVLVGTTRPVPA